MKDLWKRFEKWHRDHAPHLLEGLRPGASPESVEEAQGEMGVLFPEDLKESLLVHDGGAGVIGSYDLLSLDRMVKDHAMHCRIAADGIDEDEGKTDETGSVRLVWWDRGWIPIVTDFGGDGYCVDTHPAPKGRRGQVIKFYHDDSPRPLLANSYREWLEAIVVDLESGLYRYHYEDIYPYPDSLGFLYLSTLHGRKAHPKAIFGMGHGTRHVVENRKGGVKLAELYSNRPLAERDLEGVVLRIMPDRGEPDEVRAGDLFEASRVVRDEGPPVDESRPDLDLLVVERLIENFDRLTLELQAPADDLFILSYWHVDPVRVRDEEIFDHIDRNGKYLTPTEQFVEALSKARAMSDLSNVVARWNAIFKKRLEESRLDDARRLVHAYLEHLMPYAKLDQARHQDIVSIMLVLVCRSMDREIFELVKERMMPEKVLFHNLAYNLACWHALSGNREAMLRHAALALDLGHDPKDFAADADFDRFRDDPDFKRLTGG